MIKLINRILNKAEIYRVDILRTIQERNCETNFEKDIATLRVKHNLDTSFMQKMGPMNFKYQSVYQTNETELNKLVEMRKINFYDDDSIVRHFKNCIHQCYGEYSPIYLINQ